MPMWEQYQPPLGAPHLVREAWPTPSPLVPQEAVRCGVLLACGVCVSTQGAEAGHLLA